jgi:hypothetical protein
MQTIPQNIYNNVVIPQTRRLQTSVNAKWKLIYNRLFHETPKRHRDTIQKINKLKNDSKLLYAVYGLKA